MSAIDEIGPIGELPGWKLHQIALDLRAMAQAAADHTRPGAGHDVVAARKALARMRAILGPERAD